MQRIAQHLSLFLTLACAIPLLADERPIDWPTFQGNNARTGATDYPAIKFPEIAWSTQVGIMGYLNCPVIDNDRVFVTSSGDHHNQPDKRDGVYCLDMKTGEVLWHYPTSSDACGITIDRQHVYAGDDAGMFQVIDRKTGELVWRYEFNGSVFGQPLRVGDLVIAGGAKGVIHAFDPGTGKKRWSFHHDDTLRAGLSSDGKQVYAVYLHGRCVCFDLEGKVLWQRDALDAPEGDEETREIYAPPTIVDQHLFFGFARDTTYPVPAISCLSTDGVFEWCSGHGHRRVKSFGNIRSSFAVYQGQLVYGEPYGNNVIWANQFDGTVQGSIATGYKMFPHWPSPVIAGEYVYLPRHDGSLEALPAARGGSRHWMVYLGSHAHAKVAQYPQQMHGSHIDWNPKIGKPLYATPAIAKDGTLVIGSGEGWLYCIRHKQ